MGRGRWRRLGNRPRRSRKGCAQGEGARPLRGLWPAEGLGPVSLHRRRKEAQMTGLRIATVVYDTDVEPALPIAPSKG
jgi:hypothetical protein